MSEHSPSPERRNGKYGSARDEVLHQMSIDGWANKSDGDVQAPSGFFSLILNSREELAEIVDAFEADILRARLFNQGELIGNFLLLEDELGFVTVVEYATPAEAAAAYEQLEGAFSEWLSSPSDM